MEQMFNICLNPFLILKTYFNIVLIFVKFCLFLAVLLKIAALLRK